MWKDWSVIGQSGSGGLSMVGDVRGNIIPHYFLLFYESLNNNISFLIVKGGVKTEQEDIRNKTLYGGDLTKE